MTRNVQLLTEHLYAVVQGVFPKDGHEQATVKLRGLITYTQAGESGASLSGAGWKVVGERAARGSWAESSVKLRDRRDPVGSGGVQRTLWEAVA